MEILDWTRFAALAEERDAAVTIGVFDGLHRGHMLLIGRVVRSGLLPTVVTFRQFPKTRVDGKPPLELLPMEERLELIKKNGVSRVVLIDFSENFSKMSYREFLDVLRVHGGMKLCVIGDDFHCGHEREGNPASIREYNAARGVRTEIMPRLVDGGKPVSSTRIRAELEAGNISEAERLLGRKLVTI
jgi:riboflavin kinase/FMN adenylyltransferase